MATPARRSATAGKDPRARSQCRPRRGARAEPPKDPRGRPDHGAAPKRRACCRRRGDEAKVTEGKTTRSP
jgi:hypothetical protein